MRGNRQKGTKPELAVRKMLHHLGFRFRLHRRDLPGTPDIVFPGRRKVIQVHGCFWHQHDGCRHGRIPTGRQDYWGPKLARNKERDLCTGDALQAMGWKVLTVWECELKDEVALVERLCTFLEKPNAKGEEAED